MRCDNHKRILVFTGQKDDLAKAFAGPRDAHQCERAVGFRPLGAHFSVQHNPIEFSSLFGVHQDRACLDLDPIDTFDATQCGDVGEKAYLSKGLRLAQGLCNLPQGNGLEIDCWFALAHLRFHVFPQKPARYW